jgi:hypothetical protein
MLNFTKFQKMDEKKAQKIMVFTSLSPADKNLILSGIRIALIFKKELCILYRINKKEERTTARQKLRDYVLMFKDDIGTQKISILLTDEKIQNLPEMLADNHEAIMLIANALEFKKFAAAVTETPIPFLFINPGKPLSEFKKIVAPIDIRKENNDLILWCSWFGRFNKSEIFVIAANEKRQDSQQQVAHNLILSKKLFQKTAVSHRILKGNKSSLQNSFEAAEFARSSGCDLLVLLGSSVITPLDMLIGLPERKIVSHALNPPVLLVNPRIDNYILCD